MNVFLEFSPKPCVIDDLITNIDRFFGYTNVSNSRMIPPSPSFIAVKRIKIKFVRVYTSWKHLETVTETKYWSRNII